MSFSDSNHELVELTDDAKKREGENYVERPYYREHPTKAVAVLTFGKTRDEFWIQQRPPEDCKPLHWEIVAGSKSSEHDSMREAAQEEIREELYGDNLEEAPEKFDLTYLGKTYKDTENPQEIDIFVYDSGRNDFPGSDEVYNGRFIDCEEIPRTVLEEDVTDCTNAVLDAVGLLENTSQSLRQLDDTLDSRE